MTNEKPAPRTAAGRALMEAYRTNGNQLADWLNMRNAILAIEAEAAAAPGKAMPRRSLTLETTGARSLRDTDSSVAAPAATSASAEAEGSPLDVERLRQALVATAWSHDPDGAAMWVYEIAAEYARLTAAAEASGE